MTAMQWTGEQKLFPKFCFKIEAFLKFVVSVFYSKHYKCYLEYSFYTTKGAIRCLAIS